jgi:hypothetical protein
LLLILNQENPKLWKTTPTALRNGCFTNGSAIFQSVVIFLSHNNDLVLG